MTTEEERILLSIDSNLEEYTKQAAQAQQVVDGLKDALDRMQKSGESSAEEIEATKAQLREAQKQYRESTKSIDDLTKANNATAGSYEQLQAQLRLAEKNLKTQSGLLTRNADGTIKLSDAYVKASKEVADARNAVNQFNLGINNGSTNVGLYQQSIQKALGSMGMFGKDGAMVGNFFQKVLPTGIKSTVKGLNVLKMALISTGLGAFVVAFGSLITYFKQSADGQEKLNVIMGYFKGIVQALTNTVVAIGRALMNAFENPKQAIIDLWETMKQNVINRFNGFVDMFVAGWKVISQGAKGVGLAIAGIFSEEKRAASKEAFQEMGEGMIDFGKAALQAATGVEDIIGKVGEWAKGIQETSKEMSRVAKMENQLRRLQIESLTAIAEIEAEIAKQRLISQDNSKAIVDQIKAQERAMALVQKKFDIERQNAALALKIQQERMALGENTLEDLEKEAQLKAELIKMDTAQDSQMRELVARYNELLNRQRTLNKETKEGVDEEAQKRLEILEQIRQAGLTDIQRLQEEMQQRIEMYRFEGEQRATLEQFYADQISGIKKRLADEEIAYRKMVVDATLGSLQNLLGAMAMFTEEGSAINKAFAITDALINTYRGVTKALELPTPQKWIEVAATLTYGLATVRKIMSVKPGKAGGAVSGGSTPRTGGFVATRAGGAIAQSNNVLPNISQNIGTVQPTQASQQAADSNSLLINAIQNLKVYTIIEEFEKAQKNKTRIEQNATF